MPTTATGEELTRWMNEQSNFRSRLEIRMAERDRAIMDGLGEIKDHLTQLNGRTAKNTENIAVLDREFDAIQSEARHIETVVESIKKEGCSQYQNHSQVLQEVSEITGWSRQKKMAVVGGLLGTGALIWPALTEVAKAIQAVLDHTRGVQ